MSPSEPPTLSEVIKVANERDISNAPLIKVKGVLSISETKLDGFDGYWAAGVGAFNYDLWEYLPFSCTKLSFDVDDDTGCTTNAEICLCLLDARYDDNDRFCGWLSLDVLRANVKTSFKFDKCLVNFSDGEVYLDAGDATEKAYNQFGLLVMLAQEALIAIHSGCEAKLCRITDKQKRINERRVKDGKKPVYEEQTIKIKPSIYYKPTGQHRNYTPPCAHQRRGHFRTYPSGKRGWVKDCKVSQGSERSVKSNYVFEYDVV